MARSDIFTPPLISQKMASYLHPDGSLLEPSVGTGQLLSHLTLENYNIDAYDINPDYLKISSETYSNHSKHSKKKSIQCIQWKCQDFLSTTITTTYQNIILNPPYIRFQDLDVEYRAFIKKEWPILSKGNIDLYYAFLVKCLDCLAEEGVMVAITPNSYLYNKSALSFRQYLIANRFIKEIIDYKSEKVFPGVSTYCCITVFTKVNKTHFIYNNESFAYEGCTDSFFSSSSSSSASSSKTLGDRCRIRNGIATLRDKIFIHPSKRFDEPCWKTLTTSQNSEMWVIHPYENGVIIPENVFRETNPQTYHYLVSHREELAKRDKGGKTYPEWYAYGRTQSLTVSREENVLYVPTFLDPSVTIPCRKAPPTLFSGCLCIDQFSDDDVIDEIRQLIIDHRDYISQNSSKRGGGWINLTSTTLKMIPYR
jgi:hypothetical protein